MRYQIVKEENVFLLADSVNTFLSKGWVLHGSIAYVQGKKGIVYHQAMTKED